MSEIIVKRAWYIIKYIQKHAQYIHVQGVKKVRKHRPKGHCLIKHLDIIFCCYFNLIWFVLSLNVTVNNFSVMSGRSQIFLGLTSTVGNYVSCSRTQHGDAYGDRTQDLSIRSPTLYHYATTLPIYFSLENIAFNI